jgi:hypothetical protein
MAAVRDVPDMTRQEVTVCARHRFLRGAFSSQKLASKLLIDAFYATLHYKINHLWRSDPGPQTRRVRP